MSYRAEIDMTIYKIRVAAKFKGEQQWREYYYGKYKDDIGSVMPLFLEWVNGTPKTARLLGRRTINNEVIILLKYPNKKVETRRYSIISINRVQINKVKIKVTG